MMKEKLKRPSSQTINILNVVTSIDLGGVSTLLLSYYSHMDLTGLKIDIVAINKGKKQMFAEDFRKLGCNVYYMPKNYFHRFFFFINLIYRNNYQVIHSHMDLASAGYLCIAKIMGIKKRIAHAHMAFWNKNKWYHRFLKIILNNVCTDRWGCSIDALKDLFGNKYNEKSLILKDAIDLTNFTYNEEIRDSYRNLLKIKNSFVVGFVGRLSVQKNPLFVLNIFSEILHMVNNAVLLVCGSGEMYDEFMRRAEEIGVKKSIIYLGQRKDVGNLMMSMDCLLVPSVWEGLGIVLIEAQATSLQCIASDEGIPKETHISNYVHYLSRHLSPREWADYIVEKMPSLPRKNMNVEVTAHGYNIEKQAFFLRNSYLNL